MPQGNPTKEDKNMSKKVVIVCLWLLFCGNGLAQEDVQFQQQIDSLACIEGILRVNDNAIQIVESTVTKDSTSRNLILSALRDARNEVEQLELELRRQRMALRETTKPKEPTKEPTRAPTRAPCKLPSASDYSTAAEELIDSPQGFVENLVNFGRIRARGRIAQYEACIRSRR